jgi:hypothetical protein
MRGEAAVEHSRAVDDQVDALFKRMMAIPCATHFVRDEWRGPDSELDYDKRMVRALLG